MKYIYQINVESDENAVAIRKQLQESGHAVKQINCRDSLDSLLSGLPDEELPGFAAIFREQYNDDDRIYYIVNEVCQSDNPRELIQDLHSMITSKINGITEYETIYEMQDALDVAMEQYQENIAQAQS